MRSTTRPRGRCRTPSCSPRSRRCPRPSRSRTTSMPEPRVISFREALREAMVEEMERDPSIFLMGEEVGHYNGAYKVSEGMLARFGEARVIDTPIAETGFAGVGVGAAMVGLRPIIEFMTWNFSLTAIDQLINNAAKLRYMANGQFTLPIVFRGPGRDVTLVTWSKMVHTCLGAAEELARDGVEAEVLDLRTIRPLDAAAILASVQKTHRCVVVQEGWPFAGVAAEVVALVACDAFDDLDAPPERVTSLDVPMPYARNLEERVLPSPARVIATVRRLLGVEETVGAPVPPARVQRGR